MRIIFDKKYVRNCGFTLIELLVVMAIMGILAVLIIGGFRSSQMRSRDATRKANLKQIANALEMFYSDYDIYPASSAGGEIQGCSYDPETDIGEVCDFGSGDFTDDKTEYMKIIPTDPSGGSNYYYRYLSVQNGFQLFAHLENLEDPSITEVPEGVNCGGEDRPCNFAITSPNVTPTEE